MFHYYTVPLTNFQRISKCLPLTSPLFFANLPHGSLLFKIPCNRNRLTAAANNKWYDIVKALAAAGAEQKESKTCSLFIYCPLLLNLKSDTFYKIIIQHVSVWRLHHVHACSAMAISAKLLAFETCTGTTLYG